MRFYDKVAMLAPSILPDLASDALGSAVVINAVNVYEYMYNGYKDDWHLEDLPSLAPPFPVFFIEGQYPDHKTIKKKTVKVSPDSIPFMKKGDLFISVNPEKLIEPLGSVKNLDPQIMLSVEAATWAYILVTFIDDGNGFYTVPSYGLIPLDEAGFYNLYQDRLYSVTMPEFVGVIPESDFIIYHRMMAHDLIIPLMAIGLMNCKNVELVENVPRKTESKRHQRKHGKPLTKYYTLKVNSMRKEYTNDGDGSHAGGKRSLHIARGHFKDYRGGGGLFGKLNGVYWWDAHVRGDSKTGIVHKDYQVEPPKNDE